MVRGPTLADQAIPRRPFGNTGVSVSALGFGGHHLGAADNQEEATRLISEAIDGGVTFFDNCWEYHRGKTEVWMGNALKGKRDKVFLMTKVCTHGRDKALAMRMLEESLRRLQTEYLDLWQIHGVTFDNDPDLFIRPNGAAEALDQARREGKVRFVGFTGHKSPAIHLKMLATGFKFNSAQMPLNVFDATFLSFQTQVVPELKKHGMAVLGMKPINGHGEAVEKGVLTAEEALRYAMSLPVTTTITGMERMDIVRHNLKVAQGFSPMTADEMRALETRCRSYAADGRFELYKVSLKFDNPEARLAHQFPLDDQSDEVKEMMKSTLNTGKPFPKP